MKVSKAAALHELFLKTCHLFTADYSQCELTGLSSTVVMPCTAGYRKLVPVYFNIDHTISHFTVHIDWKLECVCVTPRFNHLSSEQECDERQEFYIY